MKEILIVDDDDEVRENLEEILNDDGYSTQTAVSALDALDKVSKKKFEVILLDYMMPDKTGLDILSELKRANPKSKIIMITAFATIENAVDAIKKGANEYISKPFKIDQLLVLIRQVLEEIRFEKKIEKSPMEETLSSLSNSIRRETMRMFRTRKTLRLMEITRELKIDDHTKVVFHLRSLKQAGIIDQDKKKLYHLTSEGKNVLTCLDLLENFMAE